jgi:hypothetical protein
MPRIIVVHYEWQKVLYDTANVIFTARVIPRVVKSRHNIIESVSCVGGQNLYKNFCGKTKKQLPGKPGSSRLVRFR